MDYPAYSALLLARGPVFSSGAKWIRLTRQLLTERVAVLKEAEWLDYRRGWPDQRPPDIHTETSFDNCIEFGVRGQVNGLLELKLKLYEGNWEGMPKAESCVFVIADCCLPARSIISLTTGCNSRTDLDSLLQMKLRQVAEYELERKEAEAREKLLQEEEAILLKQYKS